MFLNFAIVLYKNICVTLFFVLFLLWFHFFRVAQGWDAFCFVLFCDNKCLVGVGYVICVKFNMYF